MLRRRDEQKQRTRARIISAARKLFADPGYEATTIRMIAAEAGVATGSVFTTFTSKEDVLFAIVGELVDEIEGRVTARMASARGTARERMKVLMCEVIAAMEQRLPLMMIHLSLSWRWSHEVETNRPNHVGKILRSASDLLRDGVASGEISPNTDIKLLGEVLADICVRNVRRVWYRGLDRESLAAVTARQVDLIFDGARGAAP